MKTVRSSIACSVMLFAAQAHALLASGTDSLHLPEEQSSLVALDGGSELLSLNGPLFNYIRAHADELAQELLYLVDHAQPEANAALHIELITIVSRLEAVLATKPFAQEQTTDAFLKSDAGKTLFESVVQFWSAIKDYADATVDTSHCPTLSQALSNFDIMHVHKDELHAIFTEQMKTSLAAIPAYDEETQSLLQAQLLLSHYILDTAFIYMQTEQHTQLLKDLIIRWAAFMKEDAFFNELQTKQLSTQIPAAAEQFFVALERYGRNFQQACFAGMIDETGYEADDEIERFDDCCEIDFNAHFKKGL
jgi:hypothetical protein